jgi:hypothetical protein
MFREMYPERKFIDDFPDAGEDLSTVTNEGAIEILKGLGRDGFTPLKASIKAATEQFLKTA